MTQRPPSLDSYTLGRLIGVGSTGEVFAATLTRVGDDKPGRGAVKLAAFPRSTTPEQLRARWPTISARLAAIASLNSIMTIDLWEWGLSADARVWIAMERLDPTPGVGIYGAAERELAWPQLLTSALAEAHDTGVVHGDIKPSNIIIDGARPVLIDFALTDLDPAPGAPHWMAPECLEGSPATAAADVYALAQCFVEAWTGKPAFRPTGAGPGRLISLLSLKTDGEPIDPGPTMSPGPRAALVAATQARPDARPTAAELAAALA